MQSLLPAEERLVLRLPSQKQQVSDRGQGRRTTLKRSKKKEKKKKEVGPSAATRHHTVPLEALERLHRYASSLPANPGVE